MTQLELATMSTVSIRAIRNLELGLARNPRRETVRLLADALRLSGWRRAALQLAAGHTADDDTFAMSMPRHSPVNRSLVGRENEVARLAALVAGSAHPIIRITGIGGVGKTRLARAVADGLRAERGIACLWMSVASEADGDPAYAVWTDALVEAVPRAIESLCDLIGGRSVLLIIDGDDDRRIAHDALARLVRACPNLRTITTSRQPAKDDSHQVPLWPLPTACPPGSDLSPAARLLLTLVDPADGTFILTTDTCGRLTRICELLDGIPRSIESAAAWFRLSSTEEIAAIARNEPLTLTAVPARPSTGSWVYDAVWDATGSLPERQRAMLEASIRLEQPWSLGELTRHTGSSYLEAASALHEFTVRGVVAPTGGDGVRFSTLNLVRAVWPCLAHGKRHGTV